MTRLAPDPDESPDGQEFAGGILEGEPLVREMPEWSSLLCDIPRYAALLGDKDVTFDFRLLMTSGDRLARCGKLMWPLVRSLGARILVGPGFGAAPLLAAIVLEALKDGVELDYLMVRDERKAHNRKRWVEGAVHEVGARAVIIDDFMGKGSAIDLIDQALRADKHELSIVGAVVLFDMWSPLGSRQLSIARFPILSVYRRHDIGLSRDSFDAKPPLMKGSHPDFVEKPLWWRFDLNVKYAKNDPPRKCTPLVLEDAVFVGDDKSRMWRLSAWSGDIEWRVDSVGQPKKGIVQSLQAAEDSLIYGCYDGALTKVAKASGEIVWRRRQGTSIHATPCLDIPNRRVFIATEVWNNGNPVGDLCAVDWDSGRLLWSNRQDYWIPASPVYDPASDLVFTTPNDKTISAVSAKDGKTVWRHALTGLVRGRPKIFDGNIYYATENGYLGCRAVSDGALRWQKRYGPGQPHQFVDCDDNCVYAVDSKRNFVARDRRNGDLVWLSRLRGPANWGPVRFNKYLLLLSTGGELAVLDPRRRIKVWEGRIGGQYHQPPHAGMTRQGGLFVAASNARGLLAFNIHPHYCEA